MIHEKSFMTKAIFATSAILCPTKATAFSSDSAARSDSAATDVATCGSAEKDRKSTARILRELRSRAYDSPDHQAIAQAPANKKSKKIDPSRFPDACWNTTGYNLPPAFGPNASEYLARARYIQSEILPRCRPITDYMKETPEYSTERESDAKIFICNALEYYDNHCEKDADMLWGEEGADYEGFRKFKDQLKKLKSLTDNLKLFDNKRNREKIMVGDSTFKYLSDLTKLVKYLEEEEGCNSEKYPEVQTQLKVLKSFKAELKIVAANQSQILDIKNFRFNVHSDLPKLLREASHYACGVLPFWKKAEPEKYKNLFQTLDVPFKTFNRSDVGKILTGLKQLKNFLTNPTRDLCFKEYRFDEIMEKLDRYLLEAEGYVCWVRVTDLAAKMADPFPECPSITKWVNMEHRELIWHLTNLDVDDAEYEADKSLRQKHIRQCCSMAQAAGGYLSGLKEQVKLFVKTKNQSTRVRMRGQLENLEVEIKAVDEIMEKEEYPRRLDKFAGKVLMHDGTIRSALQSSYNDDLWWGLWLLQKSVRGDSLLNVISRVETAIEISKNGELVDQNRAWLLEPELKELKKIRDDMCREIRFKRIQDPTAESESSELMS